MTERIKAMESYKYRGYIIKQEKHPTPLNPHRMTWDIFDGDKCRKSNIGSIEVAKHYIDVMLKYYYWREVNR